MSVSSLVVREKEPSEVSCLCGEHMPQKRINLDILDLLIAQGDSRSPAFHSAWQETRQDSAVGLVGHFGLSPTNPV